MRLTIVKIEILSVMLVLSLAALPVKAEISITGLPKTAQKNVQLMLSLAKEQCQAPEWKIRGLYQQADEEVDEALRALGFYHSVVKKSLLFKANCWQADFAIDAGPQVIVDDISIVLTGDAEDDPEFKKLLKDLQAEIAKPLRHDHYEKMKQRIEALAMERGYLNAAFSEKQLLIDKRNNKAHFNLVFDAGKRMVFGEVTVEQAILRPKFVEEYISIKRGDIYSGEQLAKTHNALSKSNYFEMIDIRPETDNIEQQQVPVTLKLYPRKKYHYAFGLGFDTDIGPLLSASYINRWINRRGHFLNANIDFSPVLSTADIEYSIPLDNPISDFFSFGGGLKREYTDTFKSLSGKLSARLKHAFANGWKQTLYLDAVYEDYTTGTTSNQVLLLVPGGNWLRSVSDNPFRPTQGHRLELNLAGSYKNPLSDVSFAQGSVAAVWMQPLPWKGGSFIARTEWGATFVDAFEKLPTSYRFYAGGMNSIRGYAYKELGPKDDQGNVVGGRFLTVLSAEFEQSVLNNWGVAAFLDGGNAYNLDNISFKTGAGLGVRWYSPIGPVRLDFALPLNDSTSSFQIHFAAGSRV